MIKSLMKIEELEKIEKEVCADLAEEILKSEEFARDFLRCSLFYHCPNLMRRMRILRRKADD